MKAGRRGSWEVERQKESKLKESTTDIAKLGGNGIGNFEGRKRKIKAKIRA